MQTTPDLMTTREVADLLRVTPAALKMSRSRGTQTGSIPSLPYIRLGRNIRYDRNKVLAVLEACEVTPEASADR